MRPFRFAVRCGRIARGLAACLTIALSHTALASEPDTPAPWPHGAMVSAANPYAVAAGQRILEAGGHAVDAAIAVHAVLGLVEPQSSGIGGGAFMLVYQRDSAEVAALDGRETAPATASADMFTADGAPLDFVTAWQSGLSVGVPGVPALYLDSHRRYGRLSLTEVLTPAIELARRGFEVSARLNGLLERVQSFSRLDDNPDTADYFYPDGKPLPVGFLRTNPAYAETLENLARDGFDSFYRGALAARIVAAAQAGPNPGRLTEADLAGYRSVHREALCSPATELRVCTMPPPSSGVAAIMMLNLYDRLTAGEERTPIDRWAAFVDAQRLAYADRDRYIGDPAFAEIPVADLVNPAYLDERAAERPAPARPARPGDPGAVLRDEPMLARYAPDSTRPLPSTTHLSVIDGDGNAVSMTASVEAPFGSSRWAGGFLLNNQLTDFARNPGEPGTAAVNIALPGKRPRSSMSPVLVFDGSGGLRMVSGSPGGNSIIAYVAKTLIGALRWDLGAQAAVDLPNVVARGLNVRVETGVAGGQPVADGLTALGYPVEETEGENSGLHVIVVGKDGLDGAADPRREGEVATVR